MTKEQVNRIAICLFENTLKLNHGTVSASLIVHEGRVVSVNHEIKEVIRRREEIKK